MDLPDSDWGDFSCRRAVDSSSWWWFLPDCCSTCCILSLRHPIWSDYIFSSFPLDPSQHLPLQRLLSLALEPFDLNHRYLEQRTYRSAEMHWMSFHNLNPRSWLWHRSQKIACMHDKGRTTHSNTTRRGSFIALVMVITWLDFGVDLLKTIILANFL